MKNIVQIVHYSGGRPMDGARYTFNVPHGVKLEKDDIVLVEQRSGEVIAKCVTDSEEVNDTIEDMIMRGKQITGSVVGAYTVRIFERSQK